MSKLVCKHVLKERWEGLLDREPCTIKVWRCWTGDQIVGVKAVTNDLSVYSHCSYYSFCTILTGVDGQVPVWLSLQAGNKWMLYYYYDDLCRFGYFGFVWKHRVACVTSCFAMFCWRQRNQQEHRQLCVCAVTVAFINSVSKQWFVPKLCFPSGSLQI